MANRIFGGVIQQLKDATDSRIGVIDAEGMVISCSNQQDQGTKRPELARAVCAAGDAPVCFEGVTAKALFSFGNRFDYAVFVDGTDAAAKSCCMMAHVALNSAKNYYEEKHDKSTFVKNIITDNILPGDIYIRAKELHFLPDQSRVVFLVRQTGSADGSAVEALQALYPDRQQEFVLSINETDIAIVKLVNDDIESDELIEIATQIEQTLKNDLYLKVTVGIGTVAHHLRELADSYKEAQVAIEVGKVFETEKTVINYENLGIGRLIYQLPTTLCEIFLNEVFKKNSIDSLDQETLFTINKFFENNLNVSETSRKLFVHRNTLVYRLEKIKKLTGLDLREFDHAIIFKVALMVKKYLASRENRML